MGKALIAMSGGVDSSVAALIMKNRGYECVGCTMKLHDFNSHACEGDCSDACGSSQDVEDARMVADKLGIPFRVADKRSEFQEKVIDRFIRSYEQGITPNPCIDCNKYMKFQSLYDEAREAGCEYIVTGHYAIIEKRGDYYQLRKGADESKDQSYVLYDLTQEQLARTILPLSQLTKQEIRCMAEEAGFTNAKKVDSQDICFIPDGNYVEFLKRNSDANFEHGNFVDMDGNVLGEHSGIACYTIGQHKKLGIALGKKAYVHSINPEDNTVTLSDNEDLYGKELVTTSFNWTCGYIPEAAKTQDGYRCKARIRYNHHEQPAIAWTISDGRVRIVFDEPQRAITPGQSAVIYDGDLVIGGGIISK